MESGIRYSRALPQSDPARLDDMLADTPSKVDFIHVDIMDGDFVPGIMTNTAFLRALREKSTRPLELHFSMRDAENRLQWFGVTAGDRVAIHAEATFRLNRALDAVRKLGASPLIALNPSTPLRFIEELLPAADGVLLLNVKLGFRGAYLVPAALEKIRRLADLRAQTGGAYSIAAEGCVSDQTAPDLIRAGADWLVLP